MSEVPFSLLLPVYAGDDPGYLTKAYQSAVLEQTLPPDELVLVQDGPVTAALADVLERLVAESPVPVRLVRLERNEGLAEALTRGLAACSHEIVARMDADDIALPQRFAEQVSKLAEEDLDILGSGMFEFAEENGAILGRRTPPVGQHKIESYSRFHDPFNHPTVVYRKSAVERAGGYKPMGLMEDYWLFARMLQSGSRADNLATPLVMYRVGAGAYRRRGGVRQLIAELRLQREFRRSRFTSRRQMARNVALRATYRLIPEAVRRVAYRRLIVRDFR